MKERILYVREDKRIVRALIFNVVNLSKIGTSEFEGEDKKLKPDTGEYDVVKIHAVIHDLGKLKHKRKFAGYKYVFRNVAWNGLKIIGRQRIEKLTSKERKKLVHISLDEIQAILKEAYKKDPSNWTSFEDACQYIRDKEDRYFRPVRRKQYKDILTGDVYDANIDIDINEKKYHVTVGTLAKSVDCDNKGGMWYRFPFVM